MVDLSYPPRVIHWDARVVEQDIGESREQGIAGIYFDATFNGGARPPHHQNAAKSSHDTLRPIMRNDPRLSGFTNDTTAGAVVGEGPDGLARWRGQGEGSSRGNSSRTRRSGQGEGETVKRQVTPGSIWAR